MIAGTIVVRPLSPIKRLHHPKLPIFITETTTNTDPIIINSEAITTKNQFLSRIVVCLFLML